MSGLNLHLKHRVLVATQIYSYSYFTRKKCNACLPLEQSRHLVIISAINILQGLFSVHSYNSSLVYLSSRLEKSTDRTADVRQDILNHTSLNSVLLSDLRHNVSNSVSIEKQLSNNCATIEQQLSNN